jgi:hypothetical protein
MNEPRTQPTPVSTRDIANAAADRRANEPPHPPEGAQPAIHGPDAERRTSAGPRDALFPAAEIDALRTRWEAIQTGFVDEPKTAVTEADALVAQTVTRLAEVFAEERSNLEKQWGHEGNISTEDLRVALRRYRSFFDRLLSV